MLLSVEVSMRGVFVSSAVVVSLVKNIVCLQDGSRQLLLELALTFVCRVLQLVEFMGEVCACSGEDEEDDGQPEVGDCGTNVCHDLRG